MASALDLNALMASLSFWEMAGYISVSAVAIGVAGEFTHDFVPWLRRKSAWWDKWGGKVSGLVLIVALAAEIVTQAEANSTSGQIIAVLEDEAAQTRERAARIEQAAAWRILNNAKAERFENAVAQGTGRPITVGYAVGDPESIALGAQLSDLLLMAHWDVSFVGHWYEGVLVPGIRVLGSDEIGQKLIRNALTAVDLPYSDEPMPIPPMYHGTGISGETRLFLYVGTKPPPKF
jgi:hypothetical protein